MPTQLKPCGRRNGPMVEDRARRRSGKGAGGERREFHGRGRRCAGRQCGALVLGVLLTFGFAGHAASAADGSAVRLAQRTSPRISVPSILVAEPASQLRLSIQVEPVEALPAQAYM